MSRGGGAHPMGPVHIKLEALHIVLVHVIGVAACPMQSCSQLHQDQPKCHPCSTGPSIRLATSLPLNPLSFPHPSSRYLKLGHSAETVSIVSLSTSFTLRPATARLYAMAFLQSPALPYAEEGYSAPTDYEDTMRWFPSAVDSTELQSGEPPPALLPEWEVDATIDPALLLTQHQCLESYPNNATPIQQS